MKIKGIIFEDFVNYKKSSMTIMMPKCTFKCDKEAGCSICQNSHLVNQNDLEINPTNLIDKYYIDNNIIESLVFQGLEPFDTFDDLLEFISTFITKSTDDIVIYTGYNKEEISDKVDKLKELINGNNSLIIKFGRFIPDSDHRYDQVLGLELASDNQYAEVIS